MIVDISIDGNGFYAISGNTEDGIKWLFDNVEDTHIEGFEEVTVIYSDDTRMSQDIAEGATDAGLTVTVDGYLYLSGGLKGELVK